MESSLLTVSGQVLRELVLFGLGPAVGLALLGAICHRVLPAKLPLLKRRARGAGGFGARRVAVLSFLAGGIVGAITLSPLPLELAVLFGALCTCVFIAILLWLTGDVISGVFIIVSAMLAGAATFESLVYLGEYGAQGADNLDALRSSIVMMWTVYAFPGFIVAAITAFVIISSLKVEREYDQRSAHRRLHG